MDEKRQYRRYAVEVAAEVVLGGRVSVASTQNLSNGGAALVLERSIPENSALTVTLFLTQDGIEDPDEEPFEAKATVIWSAERDDGNHIVGLRFDALGPGQQKQLQRFLAALGESE